MSTTAALVPLAQRRVALTARNPRQIAIPLLTPILFAVVIAPALTTALGGLLTHLKRNADDYQPSNITFSHIAPWDGTRLKKREKYEAMAERALRDLALWQAQRSALVA